MDLRCPICRGDMHWGGDDTVVRCARGHGFRAEGGLLRLVSPERAAEVARFEADIRRHRDAQGLSRAGAPLQGLPQAWASADPEWARRTRDLAFVRGLLSRRRGPLRVIDVAPFNGWLCWQLTRDGHDVTGVELFLDDDFGHGARRRYPRAWRALQADPTDAALIGGRVDLVVINHGLHFMPEPLRVVRRWLPRVAPGGFLVVLGLSVWRDPRDRITELARITAQGRSVGADLFPDAGPGYLDEADAGALRRLGLRLVPEQRAWRLRRLLRPRAPLLMRGVYRAPGSSASRVATRR